MKNLIAQNDSKRLLFVWLIVCTFFLMINFSSSLEFDNFKYEKEITFDGNEIKDNLLLQEYKPIEIKNMFGFGSKLFEGYILKHNNTCGINCESTMKIRTSEDGVLIDDIIFKTLKNDGNWIEQNVRSYQFYIKNETEWIKYNLGDEIISGEYEVKLKAEKKPSRTVDWIIKTNGEWLESWATWGNISEGDEAEVILNSPSDASDYLVNNITFNCSSNVTNGANLTNISLWGNFDGTWKLNESVNLKNPYDLDNLIQVDNLFYSSNTNSVFFKPDLTKLYSSIGNGIGDGYIYQYSCSNQLISSCSYSSLLNITDKTNTPEGIYINDSGTALYVSSQNGIIYQYYCSTPWDITSCSYTNELNISIDIPTDIKLNSLGTIAYISGTVNNKLYQYSCSITGNISSCSYTNELSEPSTTVDSFSLGSNGEYLFLSDWSNQVLYKYSCSTPGNITTCSSSQSFSLLQPRNIFLEESGNKIYSVYRASGRIYQYDFISNSTSTTQIFDRTISGGDYEWSCQSCDTDGDCGFATSNYTFSIDNIDPIIDLSYPTSLIDYGKINGTIQLNLSVTDDDNFDSVWYNYNGTNITIDGAVSGEYNQSNITLSTKKNVTIYANDTAGNLNTTVFSWDYLFFEEGQSFNENAYETDTETFTINISTGLDILSSTGTFVYNGTNYRTTGSCVSGNCYFSKTLDLSLVNSGEYEEKDSYWNLILYDGTTSHNLTTETQTQNVTRIHLEECGGIYTTKTLNFTAYREDNLTRINPFEIKGTFDTWLGSGNIKRSQSFDKASTSNLSLCITPTNRTRFTDAKIQYSYDDGNITYVPRDYYFLNESITNVSREILLYLLEAEDSTTFIIKVQDEKLSPVVNALVYIQRYYPSDGTYKTIQIVKTDSNGETIGFYETETVDYKHIIVKDGVTLLETSPQKVVGKEVPFTLTFTVGDALDYPWAPWIEDTNISTSLTYNETSGIITFSYIDSQEEIYGGTLLVVKESLTNSTEEVICNESSTQFAATITCDVSSYSGNIIAYGYVENSLRNLINILITSARDMFGREGLLIGVFIIMVSAFSFIWNPSAGVIGINASVIFVNLIGFISVSPIFIFSMIFISIIAIILLKT